MIKILNDMKPNNGEEKKIEDWNKNRNDKSTRGNLTTDNEKISGERSESAGVTGYSFY